MLTHPQKIAIGVVVAILVVGVVAILIWYFTTHASNPPNPPNPPGPYSCTDGKCVPCTTGKCGFDSLDECQASGCAPPPQTNFCKTNYPTRTPTKRSAHWTMVDQNVKMPKCDDLVNILAQGYLHGTPMTPTCIVDPTKPPSDPRDKMSMTYCNGNQFAIQEPSDSNKDKKTNMFPSIAPPGMTLTTFDHNDQEIYFKSAQCTDACASNETCVRGTCVSNTPSTSSTSIARKNYKLALYHGGITGKPGMNTKCYINYLQRLADFVVEKNIDIVFVNLQMPILAKMQFPYYLTPDFLAKYFVQPIVTKAPSVEFGVLAYVNPKDSSWDFQDQDGQDPSQQDYTDACTKAKLDDFLGKDYNCFDNTIAKSMQGGTSGFFDGHTCVDPKTQKAPYCLPNNPSAKTPCPNIPAQVVAYVEHVNEAITKLGLGTSITQIGYDNEDMGGSLAKDNNGNCQFQIAVKNLLEQKNMYDVTVTQATKLGYAYSMDIVSDDDKGVNFVMPEMYWFINMMGPCMGNNFQIGNNADSFDFGYPQVCTSGTVYRDGLQATKGDATKWLQYVMQYNQNLEPNSNFGTNNFTAMIKNMRGFKDEQGNVQGGPDKIWAMMSNENLSAGNAKNDTKNDLGSVPNCLARSMNANLHDKGDICGTFDGISYWSWDQVVTFYNALYDVVWPKDDPKVKPIFAVYESQFLPPSWFEGTNVDPSNPNVFSSSFNTDCALDCTDPVPCSTDKECQDFAAKRCTDSTTYCKDNHTCQFKMPECVAGDADCYASTCDSSNTPVLCPKDDKTCVLCPNKGHCQTNNTNFICCPNTQQKWCTAPFCQWANGTCTDKVK